MRLLNSAPAFMVPSMSSLFRPLLALICLAVTGLCALAAAEQAPTKEKEASAAVQEIKSAKKQVVVIPVRDQIATPILYILRRGLKEAISNNADAVVLDMKTPGGALDTTFEIMEALAKFQGETVTYINTEAISAGAFISASTKEIWFAPNGVIGAAAPVLSGGQDVEATMKQKIVSYLKARVRAMSEGKGYRGQVISAMIDADYEFKIGDKVIKSKGELLSLTATEACASYGDPAQPLLGSGTAKSLDDLLAQKYGAGNYTVRKLEVTWSEQLAVWLNAISPILLGLGVLCVFIEFKTPGFGVFGVLGIILLAVVFLGSYVAGLSGHEPILVFLLGLILVAVEILFAPGVIILALSGLVLMAGSLLWSMADLWPHEPLSFTGDAFIRPLTNLGLGVCIAFGLALLAARFLPKGWLWDRMIVGATVDSQAQVSGHSPELSPGELVSLVGQTGVAATALRPGGQVEIGGRRFEAKVEIGSIDAGSSIRVLAHTDFGLVVEKLGDEKQSLS